MPVHKAVITDKTNAGSTTPVKSTKSTKPIDKYHNLGELVFMYPKVSEVLLDFGLHCVGCGAMHYDTIEAGAKIHGFTDGEIDELVIRLNEVIEYNQ